MRPGTRSLKKAGKNDGREVSVITALLFGIYLCHRVKFLKTRIKIKNSPTVLFIQSTLLSWHNILISLSLRKYKMSLYE